ncbi:leucine-rich repeat protein kinase family protein [Tasmannia lanceolata]|uniref:leucine-rich repeat protein kinase family protein n=1 Tax=Tasmannia lanceolata TaxID=3420 RepID=UPI00406329B7
MAFISTTALLSFTLILISTSSVLSATIIEDLNQKPPPDFREKIYKNCAENPSLRYCDSSPADIPDIFKSTIVAEHLCNESRNPNCENSFTKIDLQSRPLIAPLYLSFTFFWKYCPLTVLTIDFSNNSLEGSFPSDILFCSQIQSLDASHNNFIGEIPIERFTHLTNLTFLNLSYNHFSVSNNIISQNPFFQRFNSSSFMHSGLLANDHSGKFNVVAIILLIGFLIFVILFVGCFGWICFRRPDILPSVFRRGNRFTPAMLKAATEGFSKRNLLVKNGSVEIYKGVLRDGTEVAIEMNREKILSESRAEFVEECRILVQLRHNNLIEVLGWCDHRELMGIVTKWSEVDSVERWLSLSGSPPWKQRMKVLMGVIGAMVYLQDQWPQVGYELRTSTVLLSENRKPLISRLRVGDQISSSKKVYKFGVFLLEMVANKRPRQEFERGETGFVEWMRLHYPTHVQKVMDERLKSTSNTHEQVKQMEQVKQVIGIGLACTDISTNRQPTIAQISDMINGVHESSLVSASPTHHRANEERGGHRRMQSR